MERWSKVLLRLLVLVVSLSILLYAGIAIYITLNRQQFQAALLKQLNENVHGQVLVGSMQPSLLTGFPGVSFALKDVELRDSLWKKHRRTLLTARHFNVSVNVLAFLTGTLRINRIGIQDARIYLFTDSNGYSNTSIFGGQKKVNSKTKDNGLGMEVRRWALKNVSFILDNQQANKHFGLQINAFSGRVQYDSEGWNARLNLNILVHTIAFNKRKGSFLTESEIRGPLSLDYDRSSGTVNIGEEKIDIKGEPFHLSGQLIVSRDPVRFGFNLRSDRILWRKAASLLSDNIRRKLNVYDLRRKLAVKARIVGDMGHGSKPAVDVWCEVRNNVLVSPGGTVDSCSFSGSFSNHYRKGAGFTDQNSIIRLLHFRGSYSGIPLMIDTAVITNLKDPVASGLLKSRFQLARLNEVLGEDLFRFSNGVAEVDLSYQADIINYQLERPFLRGAIRISGAAFEYVPRRLKFRKSSISLHFTKNDLEIKNVSLQSGSSKIALVGEVKNFMNFYYSAPEKILFNTVIKSPEINLGEFMGFLAVRQRIGQQKKQAENATFAHQLERVLEKSQVNMAISVDKVVYGRFLANHAFASLRLSDEGITIRKLGLRHAGGSITMNGKIRQQRSYNRFFIDGRVQNVNIRRFFYAFNNFGNQTLTSGNLRGYLFAKTKLAGGFTDQGSLLPRSLRGSIIFDLRKGALVGFEPIKGVGKFAFPFRNLDNITFSNLNGKFDLMGERIKINPMMINSSVLNMNVAGIYAFSKGTHIALDIPLRNPKKDEGIADKQEIRERRMKGIVLHILATDGEDGKIKFKWNKNHD